MISIAELVFASGIAAAYNATKASSGTMIPNVIYCNVGRKHAGLNIYHEYDTLCDICGGQPQTMPYEEEYADPKWRAYLDKYFARKKDVDPEIVHRAFRLAQDLIAGPVASNMQIAGVHGGGSPIMEDIAITGQLPHGGEEEHRQKAGGHPREGDQAQGTQEVAFRPNRGYERGTGGKPVPRISIAARRCRSSSTGTW